MTLVMGQVSRLRAAAPPVRTVSGTIRPADRTSGSLALGEDPFQALGIRLDVGTDLPHGAVGVSGADGGKDGLMLSELDARVLELAVLHREHREVEPQFL